MVNEALRSALHWLPETEVDNRFACYVALARVHAQEDRVREGLKWARAAAYPFPGAPVAQLDRAPVS